MEKADDLNIKGFEPRGIQLYSLAIFAPFTQGWTKSKMSNIALC